MIRQWIERQYDREANGDNWWRLFGTNRHEFGVGFLLTQWTFGLDVGTVDQGANRWAILCLGPVSFGYQGIR